MCRGASRSFRNFGTIARMQFFTGRSAYDKLAQSLFKSSEERDGLSYRRFMGDLHSASARWPRLGQRSPAPRGDRARDDASCGVSSANVRSKTER